MNDKTETRPMSVRQWTNLQPIQGLQNVEDKLEEDTVVLIWEAVPKAYMYQINVTDGKSSEETL